MNNIGKIMLVCGAIFMIFSVLIVTQFPPLWSLLTPRPPKPEIIYGEFPFKLEYEIQGERIVLEDTIIIEYDGIGWNAGYGNHNVWASRLASGNDLLIELFRNDSELVIFHSYAISSGVYLMGEEADNAAYADPSVMAPGARCVNLMKDGRIRSYVKEGRLPNLSTVHTEELLNSYGIVFLNWEFTPPIENNFR